MVLINMLSHLLLNQYLENIINLLVVKFKKYEFVERIRKGIA